MARILEAFHANPALGGFGSESTGLYSGSSSLKEGDCDAFAQIVKELVDNAVDACRGGAVGGSSTASARRARAAAMSIKRRVQVRFTEVSPTVLRVTVTDNGCGMACIQDCVEAFQTNKRDATGGASNSATNATTAGRYGLGLTLCLLHAQRLVPNSTASITSATKEKPHFEQRDYVVDIGATSSSSSNGGGDHNDDCVKCVRAVEKPKDFPEECGTSVSLLVPGGPMALRAWPRLSEYFARFQLSLGLPCSFEVMAPTLCSRPLFVRSSLERQHQQQKQLKETASRANSSKNQIAQDGEDMQTDEDEWDPDGVEANSDSDCAIEADQDIRVQIQRAASSHVSRNVDIKNVAHSMQPIRNGKRRTKNSPMLEVDMIVYQKSMDEEDAEETEEGETPCAQMTLVRMVNRIPLLDGAEAAACGLVQCVAAKKSMWTSFGLSIQHGTDRTAQDLRFFNPTYAIRDSESVSSFFQNRNPLYEMHEEDYDDEDSSGSSDDDLLDASQEGKSRKTRKRKEVLLPAHLRLGNILLIVQIHATPSSLPLPTLSKSRLPMNATAIDSALENGIIECLKSLQRTSPALLLTSKQLKTTVRDTRYIPATAAAMARVLCHAKDDRFQQHFLKMIHGWSKEEQAADGTAATVEEDDHSDHDGEGLPETLEDLDASKVGPWVEAKLRAICVISDAPQPRKRKPSTRNKENRAQAATTPPSPPSRQSSGFCWDGMPLSPVKRTTTVPHEHRHAQAGNSLDVPSPSKPPARTRSLDGTDSMDDGIDEGPKEPKKADQQSRILTRDEDDYDDDEWW